MFIFNDLEKNLIELYIDIYSYKFVKQKINK